ncbi:hypothetical protein ACNQFZ_10095 [Schinkia sp. CFF1]
MSAPLKSRFKRMLLLSFVVILLISGCSPTNSKTNSIKKEDKVVKENTTEIFELASVWAYALKTRDGKPRYEMMSEKAKEKFKQEQINRSGENWNYNIGVSSPWVIDYKIEMDGMTANITYITQTSDPAYYEMKEKVTFSRENGKLVVDDYQTLFEDKLIEGMTKVEIHHIYDLIKKERPTPAEVERILKSFKDLEPEYYNNIEGANFLEVVDWLYNLETSTKLDHLDDIFALHDQVDGAATETYSAIIYGLFVESPFLFVQRLSMQDSKSIVSISEELAYYAGYFNVEEIIANTKHIFSEKELSEKEQATVEEIIKALDRQLKGEI